MTTPWTPRRLGDVLCPVNTVGAAPDIVISGGRLTLRSVSSATYHPDASLENQSSTQLTARSPGRAGASTVPGDPITAAPDIVEISQQPLLCQAARPCERTLSTQHPDFVLEHEDAVEKALEAGHTCCDTGPSGTVDRAPDIIQIVGVFVDTAQDPQSIVKVHRRLHVTASPVFIGINPPPLR